MSVQNLKSWNQLQKHSKEIGPTHLRDLLKDAARTRRMILTAEGITLDTSRQNATGKTVDLLLELAREAGLKEKISAMMTGKKINRTEGRAVLHTALRADPKAKIRVDGHNVVPDVQAVLKKIRVFTESIRNGKVRGITRKKFTDVVAIGIGGSYLGPEFVYEAMRGDRVCVKEAAGMRLRFLANVDPVDVARALEGLNPETTLAIVVSKTFTTAETLLNARTVREWLVKALGEKSVARHMIAISTALDKVKAFGINPDNAFGFWDWVGGRYSVSSAVGVLPLSLVFGYAQVARFLEGARSIDRHFATAPLGRNLPVLMGLFGIWNSSFLGRRSRALLPYCQGLLKLAPHIQQVDMESNGKRVDIHGDLLGFDAGEVDFGEPGTNGQHSFYQLLHQGQVVPADFIGFRKSQNPIKVKGHPVSSHDELMANFFAQPDALAIGKTEEECRSEGTAPELVPHKVFPGNRPSSSLLLEQLTPYTCGQLLALYEHRTAVQGFIWNVNSFDQMGVELGKVLAKKVVNQFEVTRKKGVPVTGFNLSTANLMKMYLKK